MDTTDPLSFLDFLNEEAPTTDIKTEPSDPPFYVPGYAPNSLSEISEESLLSPWTMTEQEQLDYDSINEELFNSYGDFLSEDSEWKQAF